MSQEELLRACLYGDERAWEEFLRRYAALIYSAIHRHDLPIAEAEEAFQLSVTAAFRQLPRLRDPKLVVPWLIGIGSRQAIDRIRARRKESPVEEITDAMLRGGPSPRSAPALPDEEMAALERGIQVRDGVRSLPPRCQRLFHALFYEDPSPEYREIARREGIALGSIGPLRARCIERLRAVFEARGWFDA